MARRALIFPEIDALVATLEANLIEREALSRAVDYQDLGSEGLAVAFGRSISKKSLGDVTRLGIELRSLDGEWSKAPCWPALLRPSPGADEEKPRACLFVLPDESETLSLVAELLRLGCDRASFATLSSKDSGPRALVRAFEPPYYTVIRGTGNGAPFVPFVPALAGNEDVWIEYGYAHRFAGAIRADVGEKVLIGGDGTWTTVSPGEFTDVLELADVQVEGAKRSVAGLPLEEKLRVPLRLREASRNQSATLWLLTDEPDAQVESLVGSLPDDVVGRLLFAVGELGEDKERCVLLRARPGRGTPPQIDVRGTAYVSHAGIANLHVPVGAAIEPPLRRDTLREHLAPDPSLVVWVIPEATSEAYGRFGLDTIEEDAFAPLADWVEYTLARADQTLSRWVAGVSFATSAFRSFGGEWSSRGELPDAGAREPTKKKTTRAAAKTGEVIRVEAGTSPITVETPTLAALPEVEKGDRSTEQLLSELEREFLDDDAPIDSPSRAQKWQLMARLHSELGNHQDGSLCLLRWLWEAPEESVAALASAWFLVCGDETPLDELIKLNHPTLDQVRAVVAQLTGLVAAGVELPVPPSELNAFLDEHDVDLDVRSVWLGRLALSRAVGGDRLGLARARDRLLRQMRGGLSLDRDVPSFLRFLGIGGGDTAAVSELVRHLEALLEYFQTTDRTRSPVEVRDDLTKAYVALEFAYGLARLGQADTARALRVNALAALPRNEAVHGFLAAAYEVRIDQAIEGKPEATPLPATVSAMLNELPRMERYKVDRLRQHSRVLESQENLNPMEGYVKGERDPRGEEFAALRGLEDPDLLHQELGKLIALAASSGGDDPEFEERARVLDGVMDFFPLLRESDAVAALDDVIALLGDIEPSRRALLLEEALMLAGFFGREHLSAEIASSLDALLGELSPSGVADLASQFGNCLRSLRRVGQAEKASQLLDRLSEAIVGEGAAITVARLDVAAGRAYLGDFESASSAFEAAQGLVAPDALVPVERLRVICALAKAWTSAPIEEAAAGLRELAQQFPTITDTYNTNLDTHICLSVIAFTDALVLGFAGGELALGDIGRRWLDEDEYLVRRRIHADLAKA